MKLGRIWIQAPSYVCGTVFFVLKHTPIYVKITILTGFWGPRTLFREKPTFYRVSGVRDPSHCILSAILCPNQVPIRPGDDSSPILDPSVITSTKLQEGASFCFPAKCAYFMKNVHI